MPARNQAHLQPRSGEMGKPGRQRREAEIKSNTVPRDGTISLL